jgi:hypothetical protein
MVDIGRVMDGVVGGKVVDVAVESAGKAGGTEAGPSWSWSLAGVGER